MASVADTLVRRMSELAPAAVVLTSGPEHRIVYANRAFQRLAGNNPAALVGAAISDVLPSMDLAAIVEACRTGEPVSRPGQKLMLPPGEGTTWWDFHSVCLDAAGPDGPMVMTSAQEVTDHVVGRREAEEALEALDALMAHIPEGITVARGPGVQVERVSAHGRALTRKPDSELLGLDARVHPEAWDVRSPGSDAPLPPNERPLARAIATGEVTENRTLMLRRPDGSAVPVLCSAGPIRDRRGRITGGVMAWRDISDLHDAQEAARQSAEQLALALWAGGLGTWETDLTRNLTRWDARLAEIVGLVPEPGTAAAGWLSGMIHPDDRERVAQTYATACRTGSAFSCEFRIVTPGGDMRWLASQGVCSDGRAIGVARDITDRRSREERLEQALAQRDLLVREADHRIKNSLQLVASLLTMQQSRLSDPGAGAALGEAIARVQAIGEAHRSLHQSADFRTVDFSRTLADICGHIDSLSGPVSVTCQIQGALKVDAERAIPLGLLVSELLTNASRHAYPGAPGTVTAEASVIGTELVVRVADRGVGTPPEREGGGSGLGGSIVRGLSRQIGATVETVSSPESGTTVTIRLPLGPEFSPA